MGLTSAHWGVYEFAVKNGRITEMKPFAEDPDPSPIGPSIIDLLDDPMRIKAPAVRESWLNDGREVRLKSGAAIPLSQLAGMRLKGLSPKSLIGSGQHMAIRQSMPGPMAGPALAASIMHKVRCIGS